MPGPPFFPALPLWWRLELLYSKRDDHPLRHWIGVATIDADRDFSTPSDPGNGGPETRILRGAPLAGSLRAEIESSIATLIAAGGRPPRLVTVLVGSHPSAEAYRASIDRTMRRVGIEHVPLDLPVTASEADLVRVLHELGADPGVTGILVLMPLPPRLPLWLVFEHLSPLKDVDGITPTNAGRLSLGLPSLRPSTPQGGIELLDHYGIDLSWTRAVVIGRSNVVGRPFATLLTQRDATVTVCHRKTVDLAGEVRRADLVGVAAGCAGLVTAEMIKAGATVLDFGVNVVGDKIVGDADFEGLLGVAGAITPVPGGTGPVTALVLARNTVAAGFAALGGSLDHVELPLAAVPC
ncbi:MAG TPA: bifunctional 5,10-methylenetetrahydrofolate dehydrogenase/5,10-methenyltetrahydrofolate cyclohydrolase [Thermomicrobiales bacterium]|nr:bifunctional 5,10-methylenetetrahydrofolate dehydrogenase/5,10-methenyltetrahydrofolate cyclohydrolase [Thermomicrobiales bacterium]